MSAKVSEFYAALARFHATPECAALIERNGRAHNEDLLRTAFSEARRIAAYQGFGDNDHGAIAVIVEAFIHGVAIGRASSEQLVHQLVADMRSRGLPEGEQYRLLLAIFSGSSDAATCS